MSQITTVGIINEYESSLVIANGESIVLGSDMPLELRESEGSLETEADKIRNHLTPIMTYSKLALDGKMGQVSEMHRKKIQVIITEAKRINDLLKTFNKEDVSKSSSIKNVGTALATFLNVLAHRSNVKQETNRKEIQKILDAQEAVRKARRDYAIQNLKNHLTTLLFVINIINRLTINYNSTTDRKSVVYTRIREEEEKIARILQNARNTIVYSSDTLDPTLVSQLDGVCTFVGQSTIKEKDGLLELEKYEKSRKKIDDVTKKLASITESSPVFK